MQSYTHKDINHVIIYNIKEVEETSMFIHGMKDPLKYF